MVQSWMNSDNLYLKFGPDKTTANKGGEYRTNAATRQVEFNIDLTTLTETETPLSDVVVIPVGMRIQDITIITETVAATGLAIDLGLIKNSNRTTEVDFNGLLADFPTASMDVAGETNTITATVTYGGALIGTTVAFDSLVTCSRTSATAFTTGKLRVRINMYKP